MERKTMPNQAELQEEVVLGDRDELLLFRVNYSAIELPKIPACYLKNCKRSNAGFTILEVPNAEPLFFVFFIYKNLKFFIFRIIQPYLDKGG